MDKRKEHCDVGPQYLAAIIANILSFTFGMTIGWTAPMQPIIESGAGSIISTMTEDNNTVAYTPLSFYADPEQMSWIGAITCFGGVVGTPLFGYTANAYGRKMTLIFCAVPFLISFLLIAVATNPYYLYIGRIIGGVSGAGSSVIVPMYVGETAEDKIRGILGSVFNLFICIGIVTSYVVGSTISSDPTTSYMLLTGIMIACVVIFLILVMWLPETPVYSLMKDQPENAFRAMQKLRGNHRELIQDQVAAIATSVKEMAANSSTMSLWEMVQDTATRKALIIVLTVMTVQQSTGVAPILNYTVSIFNASGSSQIAGNVATIIVGCLQIVGAISATMLMDAAGRKMLLIISGVGMGICLCPITYFFYLKGSGADEEYVQSIGWVPVTALSVYIIVYGMGFGPVPYVLLGELFKPEARSSASCIGVMGVWGVSFFFLKFFGNISDALGLHVCFGLFAISSFAGAAFAYLFVVETKGKSLQEIVWELEGNTGQTSRNSPVPFLELSGNQMQLQVKS